jgi:hypothetical protein
MLLLVVLQQVRHTLLLLLLLLLLPVVPVSVCIVAAAGAAAVKAALVVAAAAARRHKACCNILRVGEGPGTPPAGAAAVNAAAVNAEHQRCGATVRDSTFLSTFQHNLPFNTMPAEMLCSSSAGHQKKPVRNYLHLSLQQLQSISSDMQQCTCTAQVHTCFGAVAK